MVTIALPADLEAPLADEARRKGITPEELAVETLRATFAAPAPPEATAATAPAGDDAGPRTLYDFLAPYLGTIEGTSENLSEESSERFLEDLLEKQKLGHL
jgi:hypothetical protein